jgi:S-adenosylmethionine/arginine decarboxylase-like enzyme
MVRIKTVQLVFEGSFETLNNAENCESLLNSIINETDLTSLHSLQHTFEPQGISIIRLLAESHAALHTWPEANHGYITITTCKPSELDEQKVKQILSSHNCTVNQISVIEDGVAS